jgi:hypothetical protein
MENSRIDAVGLLLAVVTVTLALSAAQMNFGYLSSLVGLTLLLVVLAYDRQGYRSGLQSLAFATVCGACLTLASGYLLQIVSSATAPKPDHAVFDEWLGIAWLAGALIFWGIDRARMGSREQTIPGVSAPVPRTSGPITIGQGFVAQSTPAPTPAPAPAYVPPSPPPPPQPVFQQPEPAASAYVPPPPPPLIEPVEPPVAPVVASPAPPPPVHPIPHGKEVAIYVNLLGEGMNVLRTVRAEQLGRDFYLIADEMPQGEDWEFKPGQIVRCKKKNLSNGKGLVAFEEAPRAN